MDDLELIDMPDPVNWNIVENMNPATLFNATQSMPWLVRYAHISYGRRFRDLLVTIEVGSTNNLQGGGVGIEAGIVFITQPIYQEYIRMFRDYITRLEINYRISSVQEAIEVNQFVGANCAERLVEVTLTRWPPGTRSFQSFENIFARVTKLEIMACTIGYFWNAPEYFPSVTRLIHDQSLTYVAYFNELRHLTIVSNFADWEHMVHLWELHENLP